MMRAVYIGALTGGGPEAERRAGLFHYRMDAESGRLEPVAALDGGPNLTFLALNAQKTRLYAANETIDGQVSAFAVQPGGGEIVFLGRQPVQGASPCYISLDPSGRWLLAACYSSGSLAVLPVQADGSLGSLAFRVQHEGSGPNAKRQEQAHAHYIRSDPSGRFLLAVDLGMDQVLVYRLDPLTGRLAAHDPPGFALAPGAGPRHLAYHPSGRFIYITNELNSTVTACAWDADTGRLAEIQTVSTLDGFTGENYPSDIHLTPLGDFLYAANRGENSLAAYRVDGATGRLEPLGSFDCGGAWPRSFTIDPDGRFLLVANQQGGGVAVLCIADDGSLADTGYRADIEAPMHAVFG